MKLQAILLPVMLCAIPAIAQKDSLVKIPFEVSAKANVYFGEIADTSKIVRGAGIPPVEIDIRGVKLVTFEGVEGLVSFYGLDSTYFNADGGHCTVYTGVAACGSFSGINHAKIATFLTGVIVSDYSRMELPPDAIDFTDMEHRIEYVPSFDQPFFIGDGKNKTGAVQRWHIPKDATILYLGFADAAYGPPGHYCDNDGSVKGTIVLHYTDKGRN